MATEDPLLRLQILQRDLTAFTENKFPNLERLALQLDACAEDLKNLLARKHKNDSSRAILVPKTEPLPKTLVIDELEYAVQDQFRQDALQVADELDLDEMEAAKLCTEAKPLDPSVLDTTLVFRALLYFHQRRQALLECWRLLLKLSLDGDYEDDRADAFRDFVKDLIQGEAGRPSENSGFWRKCIDGLADIEHFIAKIVSHKQRLLMTGQSVGGDFGEWALAQRALLTEQHEALTTILAYLLQSNYAQPEDYRGFLNKAASLEADLDITIHYLPVLACGAAYFGTDHHTTHAAVRDLHNLFKAGPGQLQWKQLPLKAAATLLWVAEFNARVVSAITAAPHAESETPQEGEANNKLFYDALSDKGLHFILAAVSFLKPVVWYDPARVGMIEFLLENTPAVPPDAPPASEEFATFSMRQFQVFSDALISNMHDVIRELQRGGDDTRRTHLSQQSNGHPRFELDLERFMTVMACAYDGDTEAALDFWADREGNLYGFLRWVSQRLPTPRVAAFCHLLKSVAPDEKTAGHAHQFLLEELNMTSGKLRKGYGVSWQQIFGELDVYASSLKNRPVVAQPLASQDRIAGEIALEEPETGIMLDSYLGLAAHICRTSTDARTWLLQSQPFHLGEVLFQLAQSALVPRVRACCLDMLGAMLTDCVAEVRNGVWALLDSWISGVGQEGVLPPRAPGQQHNTAKQYLQVFATNAEAGVSLISLLNNLLSPLYRSDFNVDFLPFPENLGVPHRHPGIETYVDFVLDSVFSQLIPHLLSNGQTSLIDLIRYQCLKFVLICLSSFNENIILLANTTNIAVESILETKSLTNYMRLHPFARVMEWLFNKDVLASLFAVLPPNADELASADANSPFVEATLKALQVLNLAWKLQSTYFDIVKPSMTASPSRVGILNESTLGSMDEVFLSQPQSILRVAALTTSNHVDIGLESLSLLQRIGSSRKLAETETSNGHGMRVRHGNRVIGILSPVANTLTLDLQREFMLEAWDLEGEGIPVKLIKAKAVLDMLIDTLDISDGRPSVAHSLLGFDCNEHRLGISAHSPFTNSTSLFHAIAGCAANLPVANDVSYLSWLMSVKKGCVDIVYRLISSPLSSDLISPELRSMDFLLALSHSLTLAAPQSLWNHKNTLEPTFLLDDSASAFRDFVGVRELFFALCATELRFANEIGAYSVQEKIIDMLLGKVTPSKGEQILTPSILELSDFLDIETSPTLDPHCTLLQHLDLTPSLTDALETGLSYDLRLAAEILIVGKKGLRNQGKLENPTDQQLAEDESKAILAALKSHNNWQEISTARLAALETWSNVVSLMVTKGGLQEPENSTLSLQGLSVVLPRFERFLSQDMNAAALLAKTTLSLTTTAHLALQPTAAQTVSIVTDRLLAAFRISMKAIVDSSTDLAFRDVCYRIVSGILTSVSASNSDKEQPSKTFKQVLQLIQTSGDRLIIVITEDAFAGRGITRVSALLFLDSLISLYRHLRLSENLLKTLTRLNFVPVLIESSIGSIKSALQADAAVNETSTTLSFFHTAIMLLLRISQTSAGAQLILTSGLFDAVDDSGLFSTDPDIGLDIDNPAALQDFYQILAGILRVVTATVVIKGPDRSRAFLQRHRVLVQAIFKQTSRGVTGAKVVADELGRLMLLTDYLEDNYQDSAMAATGFT